MSGVHDEQTRRAIAGDHDALSALLAEHGPRVRGRLADQINPIHRSALDIDDVMQVTYLEAFLTIARFEPREDDGAFTAWLTRIARNNLHDAIRALESAKRFPAERRVTPPNGADSTVVLYDRLWKTTTTPSRVVAGREIQAAVLAALAQLPPEYQRVLRLYDLENQPIERVSELMERRAGAVYMLRARALDRLREILCRGA
ncbi:MAG: hypothetical protein CHACPFDD_01295 [Phycisphaerae bacterium]|nr:hypothetical protein [Phycisphaerae bacterium]